MRCGAKAQHYVRSLRDYDSEFAANHRETLRLGQDIRDVQRDIAALRDANAKAQGQIKHWQNEVSKLNEDLQKFEAERDAVTQLAQQLQIQWADMSGELSRLYRSNNQLAAQFVRLQKLQAELINRRVRQQPASP